ncbi:MAG: hypothetical protein PHS30_00940 [Bacteroidales bacterium]|nr:hypothetical protein [Bacteroidales bacterium]
MKYIINIGTLLMLFISLSGSSCHREEYIYINNSSYKNIYYRFSFAYPDTTLKRSDPDNYKVNSKSQTFTTASVFAFNPTLQMFIFDADVIEKEPWDSIAAHHMVLKRYQFTESDMERMNWTITYP